MYFPCFEKENQMLVMHIFLSGMVAGRNHAHSPKSKAAQQTKGEKTILHHDLRLTIFLSEENPTATQPSVSALSSNSTSAPIIR